MLTPLSKGKAMPEWLSLLPAVVAIAFVVWRKEVVRYSPIRATRVY